MQEDKPPGWTPGYTFKDRDGNMWIDYWLRRQHIRRMVFAHFRGRFYNTLSDADMLAYEAARREAMN